MSKQVFNQDNVNELVLFGYNHGAIYPMFENICKSVAKKVVAGVYDEHLAIKAFKHYSDISAKEYHKLYADKYTKWYDLFSVADREQAAIEFLSLGKDIIDVCVEERKQGKKWKDIL